MKYFCSYSYIHKGTALFGNCTFETTVDPYDDMGEFHKRLERYVNLPKLILLFYKRVKS